MSVLIYLLKCPINGEIRYVGKTRKGPDLRLAEHLYEASRKTEGYRVKWIRSLIDKGLIPIIEVDRIVGENEDWRQIERDRIAYYTGLGCRLSNGTDGGEGLSNPTEEVRRRMSASARCRNYSEEGLKRAKESARRIGLLNRGKIRSETARENISKAFSKRRHSAATRAKMSAARKGRPHSEQHRLNLGAANRKRAQLERFFKNASKSD